MRIVLFVALVCLSVSVRAEDPKAEPESAAEPEPAAEPESTHGDAKHSGSSTSETKGMHQIKIRQAYHIVLIITYFSAGKNPANAPWALGVPAILALTAMAKFVL